MEEFSTFKPVCVALLKEPSLKNLKRVQELLENAPPDTVQELQEFIMFPLYVIISNTSHRTEKMIHEIASNLQLICQKSTIRVFKIFSDMLLQFLLLIYDINPSTDKNSQSEEVKLMATETIFHLIQSSAEDVLVELFNDNNKPLLGHLIFTLLKVGTNEEMKKLRLSALNCLSEIINKPTNSQKIRKSMSEFLPGISTHLIKIINGEVKQPYVITEAAIKLFGQLTTLLMNDERFTKGEQHEENEQWLNKTRPNLHMLLEKILKNSEYPWKVNIGLVSMAQEMIENCSYSLHPSLPVLIKKLVQLTVDDCMEVSSKALLSVEKLSKSRGADLDSAIRQNIYDIASSLPRIIAQGNTRDQHVALQHLQGHLTLIGAGLEQSMKFSGLRERFFKGLLIAATMEQGKVIEQDHPYSFRYLREDRVIHAFNDCCLALGRHSNFSDTIDYFMDVVRQREMYENEAVYIMAYLIKGGTKNISTLTAIAREYAEMLSNLENTRSNVLMGLLLLKCICSVALAMNEDFSPLLLYTLRPLLEKAGDTYFTEEAMSVLETIADVLHYASASQLFEANLDYFAPQISFQLRNILRYPKAINLLRALLLFSNLEIDQWLEHIVFQALNGLDQSHSAGTQALPYIQVLEMYCRSVYRKFNDTSISYKKRDTPDMDHEKNFVKIIEKCRHYHQNFTSSRSFNSEPELEAKEEEKLKNEDEQLHNDHENIEEKSAKYVSLVASILERCSQILPQCREECLDLALLETIQAAVAVLMPHENVLLPQVHQLWDPLRFQLLQSNSLLKQRQAFDVLALLIRSCPDFLRQRVISDIFNQILAFLQRQSSASRIRSHWKAYTMTQSYKFQKVLLEQLAMLVTLMDVPILEASKALQTLSMYLSSHQVPELQVLAKESFVTVAKHKQYCAAVWLTLHSLVSKRTINCDGLESIVVGCEEAKNREYNANAEELVEKLFVLGHTS